MKIDRKLLAAEALGLLDEVGYSGLSMRALAMRFDIQVSSLYWHLHNKDDLVSLIAAGFYERAFEAVDQSDWRPWLAGFGRAFRHEVLSHRDAAQICAISAPSTAFAIEGLDRLVQPMQNAGLSRSVGLSYVSSIISLTLGWALFEQREVTRSFLSQVLNFDESYNTGLNALITGLPGPT